MAHAPHDAAPAWLEMCLDVLSYGMAGQPVQAGDQLAQLLDTYGSDVLADVMCLWVDMVALHADIPPGSPVHLQFGDSGTGDRLDADQVPPPVRWAGRFLAAQLARDDAMVSALVATLQDGRRLAECVMQLLTLCAQTIRRYQRL